MVIAFIVLHYQTIEETKNCVKSIQERIKESNYKIIIVDNGSPNDSGRALKNLFQNNSSIDVILNKSNVGFANGHNIGIKFAKNNYVCDYIVLLNNDTEIYSDNWINVIEEKFKKYRFHVLGPDIISLDGKDHANPVEKQIDSYRDLKKLISQKRRLLLSNYLFIDSSIRFIKGIIKKQINYRAPIKEKTLEDLMNVQLQGSCLILSKLYLDNYEGLYDKTFLYFEEAILKYIAERDGLKLVYTPDIVLLHKENISTNAEYKSIRKKRIFYLKHSLYSCTMLLEMMSKDRQT
jgi:GT2 family glycosyltransferase